ncbi:RING/U-box superfamily protein [Euphorbia peplus]|nr:RING/U-box superfamily protein [Euphorbia peplus]
MGNKVGTLLHKKLKQSLLIHKHNANHNEDDNDVFCTPKTSNSDENQELLLQSDDDDSPSFICEICVESKALIDSFGLKGCSHFYCTECVVNYVVSKLDDNSITRISCPVSKCEGLLEPEFCKAILPRHVFDRWGSALCESVIQNSQKFYCPFKDCSALLIDDTGMEIQNSSCPFCKRAFCAKCRVPWHSEITCQKFQKLKKKGDDVMMIDLAKRKKWRRCPKCQFYVEKSTGCFYIKCRCGYAFCYKCGSCSSTKSHVCPKCGS